MSQPDYDRALERMASDPAFAAGVRANPAAALAGYDLTEAERQQLLAMQTEAPAVVAVAQPRALATRRSKSSMLGIGALAAVAAGGAATLGYVHFNSYARYMSLDSGPRVSITTVAVDSANDVATIGTLTAGRRSNDQLQVTKPVDSTTPLLHEDLVIGRPIGSVAVTVQRGGTDWAIFTGTQCVVNIESTSGATANSTPLSENVTFACRTLDVTYP